MNTYEVRMSRLGIMLPEEIIDYIWSFNRIWAATIIQKTTKKFIKDKVEIFWDMIRFAHFDANLGLQMHNYSLYYRNRIINNKDVLATFNACKCCDRHQKNKPNVLASWQDIDFHGTQDTPCYCCCRHGARFLCRPIETED